jgi:hypothetical protein
MTQSWYVATPLERMRIKGQRLKAHEEDALHREFVRYDVASSKSIQTRDTEEESYDMSFSHLATSFSISNLGFSGSVITRNARY